MKYSLFRLSFVLVIQSICFSYSNVGTQNTSGLAETAKAVVDNLAAEDFCAVSDKFDSNLKQTLTTETMQEAWAVFIARAGAYKRQIGTELGKSQEGFNVILVKCEFENSGGVVRVIFDAQKRIVGLWLMPADSASPVTVPAQSPQGNSRN